MFRIFVYERCANFRTSMFYVCALIFIIGTVVVVDCLPTKRTIFKRSPPVYDNILNYLSKYGYLPQSDLETGNLRTDDQLKDAIRTLQSFGNIPATGEIDDKTLQLLRRPRCGLPDVQLSYSRRRKRYTLQGQKWPNTNLTWSLQSKNLLLDQGSVRLVLHRALDVWSKHSRLNFKEINSNTADILVYFEKGYHGDGFPFDGRGQVLAHAFFPAAGRGGDAHFDEQELWNVDDDDPSHGTSLFAVAAHEFGHSLGLSHSSVSGALMYPWYQGVKRNFELPEDDREAVQRLYGPKETNREDKYPHPRPAERPDKYPDRVPSYPADRPNYNPKKYYPSDPPKAYPSDPPKAYPLPPKAYPLPPFVPSLPTSTHSSPRIYPTYGPAHNHPPPNEMPNTCDTSYDAISVIRRELFIFKGKYLWRIGEKGLYMNYPSSIRNMWNKLPNNFTHVDAVYERFDKKIVFFVGREVYLFDAHTLINGYPKPLTALGLPQSLDRVDAAMVWGHNSKTYFFSGTMYWRYDDEMGRVELDYPRDISVWRGVPYNIDAAFQWKDGATYFFKGKGFWKFDDGKMRVNNERPIPSAHIFMGCPKALESQPLSGRHSTRSDVTVENLKSGIQPFQYTLIAGGILILVAIIVVVAIVVIVVRKRNTHSYLRPKRLHR